MEVIHTEDGTMLKSTDCNHSPTTVLNACGVVAADSMWSTHCSWRRTKSVFGMVHKSFTSAGNLILQHRRITFKGAKSCAKLHSVLEEILRCNFAVKLTLMVLSAGVGKCLCCYVGCLLENRLRRLRWISVQPRIEELCNSVVFCVTDWRAMERELALEAWDHPPKSTTVTVTRRGTLTTRFTWDGAPWTDNTRFEKATEALTGMVRDLV
jgi:hypothetical protein